MAATAVQSRFHRYLPLLVSLGLSVALAGPSAAVEGVASSDYRPVAGESFFLLADGTFGTDTDAKVRLEAPGRARAAFEPYDGVDVLIYRVPQPLELLQGQKNLHRPEIAGRFRGEGVRNALRYTWDVWFKKSRLIWQQILPSTVREAATAALPAVKQVSSHSYATAFRPEMQFGKLKDFELVGNFRYPLWKAKPVQPPAAVALRGSSSDFIRPEEGTIEIPIGKRQPGLYVVEALIGKFRASTYVFVSDVVAVTKVSKTQAMVWTARKQDGRPAGKVKVRFHDGVGVFATGETDADGTLVVGKEMPEKSYLLGQDEAGGVFVSENFYNDSEVYGLKAYLFSDRPLYMPGDRVYVKTFMRQFADSTANEAAKAGEAKLTLIDPMGTALAANELKVGPPEAGATSFRLPNGAISGGYTMRLAMGDQLYDGSFRVQNYARPYYQLEFVFAKESFRIGEPVTGTVKLTYANGDPVVGAQVDLLYRSQAVTMVEGEVHAMGRFPRVLTEGGGETDAKGEVAIQLEPFKEATRVIVRARTSDGSAYRATATKEILVLGSEEPLVVTSDKLFTAEHEEFNVFFTGPAPVAWEAVRLEDRTQEQGALRQGDKEAKLKLGTAGTWQISFRDKNGATLGTTQHWVRGAGLKATTGSLTIVFDKEQYVAGETAKALISFAEPVEEALVTLERDGVHKKALLSTGADWVKTQKLSDSQWTAEMKVDRFYSPNVTMSVAYTKGGAFTFQNKGLRVRVAEVKIDYALAKTSYAPGEEVAVDVTTTVDGQPVKAHLAVGVVDEMIYALQPEVAPTIGDFFFHARRNQVRTWSSLQFHAFDAAKPGDGVYPSGTSDGERPLKFREVLRREDDATAYWNPALATDASGKARFTFKASTTLTRWRITGRAMTADGVVGQKSQGFVTEQDLFVKWSGPRKYRHGDEPRVTVVGFNLTGKEQAGELTVGGIPGLEVKRPATLKPGSNFFPIPMKVAASGDVTTSVALGGAAGDALSTPVAALPVRWVNQREISVQPGAAQVSLPDNVGDVELRFVKGSTAAFLRIADDLLDYPYGCVEQTASRLIPLAMAIDALQMESAEPVQRARERLTAERARLVAMAGPGAVFGWWGDQTQEDGFLTAYAYYADWRASRALGLQIPAANWDGLLDKYAKLGANEPPLKRALAVWMMARIGLPTKTLVEGVAEAIIGATPIDVAAAGELDSEVMSDLVATGVGMRQATLLVRAMAKDVSAKLPDGFDALAEKAQKELLENGNSLLSKAILITVGAREEGAVPALLDELRSQWATIDRALALMLLEKHLTKGEVEGPVAIEPGAEWKKRESSLGQTYFRHTGVAPQTVSIAWDAAKAAGVRAYVRYGVAMPPDAAAQLPIKVERRLFELRMQADSEGAKNPETPAFASEPVSGEWGLSSRKLYLDEIRITTTGKESYKNAIVDVPLPPGADVETIVAGMVVHHGNKDIELEKVRFEPGDLMYSVPFDNLSGTVVIQNLVRFSQPGTFTMPRARVYRMYAPTKYAFAGRGETELQKVVVN